MPSYPSLGQYKGLTTSNHMRITKLVKQLIKRSNLNLLNQKSSLYSIYHTLKRLALRPCCRISWHDTVKNRKDKSRSHHKDHSSCFCGELTLYNYFMSILQSSDLNLSTVIQLAKPIPYRSTKIRNMTDSHIYNRRQIKKLQLSKTLSFPPKNTLHTSQISYIHSPGNLEPTSHGQKH